MLPWWVRGGSMVLPLCVHGALMIHGALWCPDGAFMVLLWWSMMPPWFPLDASMVLAWCFRGVPMVLEWHVRGGLVDSPWWVHVAAIVGPWWVRGRSMVLLW